MKSVVLSFACAVLLIACNSSDKVLASHEFNQGEWVASDTVILPITAASSALSLRVYHQEDYAYENLYVKLSYGDTEQITSIPLMNNQGYWLGSKKGDSYVLDYALSDLSEDELSVEQYSRAEVLRGIQRLEIVSTK